ncbi:MAG TPA: phosphate ABC transporter substrate-binding protein PstS [Solirubrobacteraceae bacterium]|nr:phosphate ABC transporter substrate-binding protein PstS [Solirubrobacteraceae bacterium]
MRLNRITSRHGAALLAALAGAALIAACGSSSSSETKKAATASSSAPSSASSTGALTGAGSTLVAPMVEKVFGPEFEKKTGISITYGAVGSGAGIAAISAKTVDFGASDGPLTPSQSKECSGCIEIPWALASTGLSYNLEGVSHLNLSGPVIAEIFLGKITNWDAPQIAALNKGVKLPNEKITPVYRSDGSGDTYAFTHYLSEVSPEWKSRVGFATSVSFPVGEGGKGNSGVAAIVKTTPGALGNNSSFYIKETGLSGVNIENNAGNFIPPGVENVAAAAKAMLKAVPQLDKLSPSTANEIADALSVVNCPYQAPAPGQQPSALQREEARAYPISTFTYVLVRPGSAADANVKKFIEFAVQPSIQALGSPLGFSVLPPAVVQADTEAVKAL